MDNDAVDNDAVDESRPAGQSDEDSDDSVDPQSANDPDAPELPTGDR